MSFNMLPLKFNASPLSGAPQSAAPQNNMMPQNSEQYHGDVTGQLFNFYNQLPNHNQVASQGNQFLNTLNQFSQQPRAQQMSQIYNSIPSAQQFYNAIPSARDVGIGAIPLAGKSIGAYASGPIGSAAGGSLGQMLASYFRGDTNPGQTGFAKGLPRLAGALGGANYGSLAAILGGGLSGLLKGHENVSQDVLGAALPRFGSDVAGRDYGAMGSGLGDAASAYMSNPDIPVQSAITKGGKGFLESKWLDFLSNQLRGGLGG